MEHSHTSHTAAVIECPFPEEAAEYRRINFWSHHPIGFMVGGYIKGKVHPQVISLTEYQVANS
jgi:hypothetical protein